MLCKQQLDRATEVTLRTAQLPTRREQDQTLRLIHQLQVQVELLADRVERVNVTIRPS
ncbi:MAG: hypothetical protein HY782_09940 [Chloroflexi bacterium]|nr:hypothetical protein [Chloroflexota bacterium]